MTNFKTIAGGTLWCLTATLMLFAALEPVQQGVPSAPVQLAAAASAGAAATL